MECNLIRNIQLVFLAFTMFSCSQKNNHSLDLVNRYWLECKGGNSLGKVRIEPLDTKTEVKISESIVFNKADFDEKLELAFETKDTNVLVFDGLDFKIKESVGYTAKRAVFNVFFLRGTGSGMVYTFEDGVVMRYNSHDYEYLLMELKIIDGKYQDKFFDNTYVQMRSFQYIPRLK